MMGVYIGKKLTRIAQDEFHAIDKIIMGHVFDIHNEIGRFCSEKIYQRELSRRCRGDSQGIITSVCSEMPILVKHKNFNKTYFLDLVVNNSVIYEFKTVDDLSDKHTGQIINYLLLANLSHGKLINFGPQSVQYQFISAKSDNTSRHEYSIDDSNWTSVASSSDKFMDLVVNLVADV